MNEPNWKDVNKIKPRPYEAYASILGDDLADLPRATAYIECTDECKAQHAEWEKARDAYAAKWSLYCKACNGHGGETYYDDPGASDCSLPGGTMPFVEYCETCFCEGICPRCGKLAWPDDAFEQETLTCPHCSWTEGNSEHSIPERPECVCYERNLP